MTLWTRNVIVDFRKPSVRGKVFGSLDILQKGTRLSHQLVKETASISKMQRTSCAQGWPRESRLPALPHKLSGGKVGKKTSWQKQSGRGAALIRKCERQASATGIILGFQLGALQRQDDTTHLGFFSRTPTGGALLPGGEGIPCLEITGPETDGQDTLGSTRLAR